MSYNINFQIVTSLQSNLCNMNIVAVVELKYRDLKFDHYSKVGVSSGLTIRMSNKKKISLKTNTLQTDFALFKFTHHNSSHRSCHSLLVED